MTASVCSLPVAETGKKRSTVEAHNESVERLVEAMGERLAEPFTLEEMSETVWVSPFHLNRVFRQITGVPPHRFLAALRIQRAKELLLSTSRSITDISLDVGYGSLGTFTWRFTQLVGASPRRIRDLGRRRCPIDLVSLCGEQPASPAGRAGPVLTGRVRPVAGFEGGFTVIGLFRSPLAEGRPCACTVFPTAAPFQLSPLPRGRWYLMAACFPWSEDPMTYLLPGTDRHLVASYALDVVWPEQSFHVELILRPSRFADPPALVSFPLLFAERSRGA